MYFDPTGIPTDTKFDPMPAGWYHATIIGAEAHLAKPPSQAGEILKISIQIEQNEHPEHGGRQHFSYLCINHTNKQPKAIAQRHLATICRVLDLDSLEAPEDLVGAPIMVKLTIRPPHDGYEASNNISGWASANPDGVYSSSPEEDPAPAPKPQPEAAPRSGAARGGWRR